MTSLANRIEEIIGNEKEIVSTELLSKMIENIGSVDPVLRDQVIYTAFWKLVSTNRLNKNQLEYVLTTLLEQEKLLMGIEQSPSDQVFTRSFTSLVFAAVLFYDSKNPSIDHKIVREVMEQTFKYMLKEKDVRGYVEGKGWAHAAAHAADLLDSIVQHPLSTEDDARQVLQAIAHFLMIARGYQDEEEECLARAYVMLTKHHLTEQELVGWLLTVERKVKDGFSSYTDELQSYYSQVAFKKFLQSVYFLLAREQIQPQIQIRQIIFRTMYE